MHAVGFQYTAVNLVTGLKVGTMPVIICYGKLDGMDLAQRPRLKDLKSPILLTRFINLNEEHCSANPPRILI